MFTACYATTVRHLSRAALHLRGTVEHLLSRWACMPRWRWPSPRWHVMPSARISNGIDRWGCAPRGLDPCPENDEVFAAVASVLTSMASMGERV